MSETPSFPPCASWARDLGVEPAGTAPQFDVLVLVEHPLPWSRDVLADPFLTHLAQVAGDQLQKGRTVRLQAAAIGGEQRERHVVVFDRGEGPFAGYGRNSGAAPSEGLAELVAHLVGNSGRPPETMDVTDVLVCTHGSRDRCCGSMGTRLWMAVQQGLGATRVWRTSHMGGHRFAPTAMFFPDGNCWAHLDERMLRALSDRSLTTRAAAPHLRGCTAFGPAVQVADAAVLARRGWEWLSYARHGEDVGSNRVDLSFRSPNGERGVYRVQLEQGRELPVPDCGGNPATAVKLQAELRVAGLGLETWDRTE